MPAGRPTKFWPELATLAFRAALLGMSDTEMAELIDCSVPTFYSWQKAHPEFFKGLRGGKLIADGRVAHGLYLRATGFYHMSDKIVMTRDGPVHVPYREYFPPSVEAARHWLAIRRGGVWANAAASGPKGGTLNVTPRRVEITAEEAAEAYSKIMDPRPSPVG
jgi:hypothetical protein